MRLFTILLLILCSISLASCSSQTERSDSIVSETATREAEEIELPKREMVSSYDQLKGEKQGPEYICKVIDLKNISTEKAVETISRLIPNLIAVTNKDSNSLVIRGEPADVSEAARIITKLDRKVPQILIEGQVVEVSESGLSDMGLIWGKEQGSFKFSIDKDTGQISETDNIMLTLNALVASGRAKILANPKITALDGKEAEINIGSRIPYAVPTGSTSNSTLWAVQYIDAGVNLKILASVAGDGTIVSTIKPEVSNISEWRTTAAGEFPVISTRNASVTVRMTSGQTLVIGGLLNESDRENISGVPVLCEIPVLGALFSRKVIEKTRTDVVFLITPRILD